MTPDNSKDKPRLLVVTTTFPGWEGDPGPAPFVFHHARALSKRFRVTVLAPHFAGAATAEEMQGVAVRRFRYGVPASIETLTDGAGILANMRKGLLHRLMAGPLAAAQAAALARELSRGYDFVNSHWLVPSGLLASLMVKNGRARHVITAHAADYDLLARLPGGAAAARFMAGRSRAIVAVSGRLSSGLREMTGPQARIETMPMGAPLDDFAYSAEGREQWRGKLGAGEGPVALFVGKLSAKKGLPVLLEAMKKMESAERPPLLALAGDGAMRPELESLAVKLGLKNRVRFLGAVPNRELSGLYSAADAVAVPSVMDERGETEGMPVVVIEALAAGRPVAATRVCSVPPELVGKGVIEVEPNDPDGLVRGLEEALSGEARVDREALGRFDTAAVADFYAGLFLGEGR